MEPVDLSHSAIPTTAFIRVSAIPSLVRTFVTTITLAMLAISANAQEKSTDLADQTLEDLMNVKVTSVSKTEQKLSQTASAVFVITQEDIQRSGATNIPDLLRMVPGMDVAQFDGNTWAISARGLNGRFANELFVAVDGRSVYTPTWGGVFWDVLDLPLEDIERIEVIRGPGGAVWGVNAVNGVINIITKKASVTHGGIIVASGGNLDHGSATVQYGGSAGQSTDYRIFTKDFNLGDMPGPNGLPGGDGWHVLRGGFRTDSTLSPKDTLTFQGDLYTGREGNPVTIFESISSPEAQNVDPQVALSGGFLQSIWHRTLSPQSDTTLQVSFDRYKRLDFLGETRNTVDVDFQHHFVAGQRHEFVWGGDFSFSASNSNGSFFFSLNPPSLDRQFYSVFAQDEFTLIPNKVFLTGGIRIDHNSYTDFNVLPNGRIAWTLRPRHTLWAAISDAVRTPADFDRSVRINSDVLAGTGGPPTVVSLFGNPQFGNEGATAYEFGYRVEVASHTSIDVAAYYNSYRTQESTEPEAPFLEDTPAPPHLVLPSTFENLIYGEAHGLEIAGDWRPARRWTLKPAYAFEAIHMYASPTSHDTETAPETDGASPRNSAVLRSDVNLSHHFAWDANAYFVGRLSSPTVPSHTRLDTQLTWGLGEHFGLALVGQNLLRDRHLEYIDTIGTVNSTLIKRSAFAKISCTF